MTPFLTVLEAFDRQGVDYIAVGGMAVIMHGSVRTTTDLDLVIHLTAGNTKKAIEVLLRGGLRPRAPVDAREFADEGTRKKWIQEKNMIVFSFYHKDHPMNDVDIFVQHPLDYESLRSRSVVMDLGKVKIRVCGLEDLLELKKRAGRPKDLEDIRQLEQIKNAKL